MRDLNHSIARHCLAHRESSRSNQDGRHRILDQFANQLHELGYRRMSGINGLKEKHVLAALQHWKEQGLSPSTIKNRMSAIRWLGETANRPHLVQRENKDYGIDNRAYSTNEDRSLEFKPEQIAAIEDPHVRLSAELQREFGLRREEAMKFIPTWADQGDHIRLKDTWCKGGRPRVVPVVTEAQRDLLDRAKLFAPGPKDSLIPSEKSYEKQINVFEYQMGLVGLSKSHGARHAYAQARYETLTGWKSRAAGGPTKKQMTPEQKIVDYNARMEISEELGHAREQITTVYLGR